MGHPETSEIEALQFQICHAPKPAHSTTGVLFHRDTVRARGACLEGRVEVQIEPFVFRETVVCDFEDVDFVVALEVNDACAVFIEEVIGHDEAAVVVTQHDVVRTGIRAKADNGNLLGIEAVCRVKHDDLSSHERAHDQAVA